MGTEQHAQTDIPALLHQPSGQRLHHCSHFKKSTVLAEIIAAFAHSEGGTIVVGYNLETKEVVGVRKRARLERLLREAERQLGRTALVGEIAFCKIKDKDLGVIRVPQVDNLIHSPCGRFMKREGITTKELSNEEIVQRVTKKRLRMEDLGGVIVRQGDHIALLSKNLEEARQDLTKTAAELTEARKLIDQTRNELAVERTWWQKTKNTVWNHLVTIALGAGIALVGRYLAFHTAR